MLPAHGRVATAPRSCGIPEKFARACESIRALDAVPDNQNLLAGKEEEVFPALDALARRCIEGDGADVILLGSTTMHQAHGPVARCLPVPVINPGPLS